MAKNQDIFRTKTGRVISISGTSVTITPGANGSVLRGLSIPVSYPFEYTTTNLTLNITSNSPTYLIFNNVYYDLNRIVGSKALAQIFKGADLADITLIPGNQVDNKLTMVLTLEDIFGVEWIKFESALTVTINNVSGALIVEDY